MARAVAGLLLVLLVLVIARLPWIGDLGMHAATLQRLRHSPLDPGNPLVDADTPSPYYSPWMLLLGTVARLTGLSVFVVLRLAALAGLALLVTGVRRYVRTLDAHRAAPALALLALLLLWGTTPFLWSGFPGLTSLALTVSYPSTLTLGLAFHFWAWLTGALRGGAGWGTWLGLGALWAVILLCHQFSGVVASLGACATVAAARPGRAVWPRAAAGLLLGAVVLGAWPYYDFFALFGAGAGLESVHRVLYDDPAARFGLVLLGAAALVARWRRDRRDPLAPFFLLGLLVVAAGWLSGHYSWGRALPAVVIPAQLAAALEAVRAGRRGGARRSDGPARRGARRRGVGPGGDARVRGPARRPAAGGPGRAPAALDGVPLDHAVGGVRGRGHGRDRSGPPDPGVRAVHGRPRLPRLLPAGRGAPDRGHPGVLRGGDAAGGAAGHRAGVRGALGAGPDRGPGRRRAAGGGAGTGGAGALRGALSHPRRGAAGALTAARSPPGGRPGAPPAGPPGGPPGAARPP
ncbi:hypothetical protein GCM10019016_111440 [Streptomyces prasinosporus]|uniref:Integral membrane protein n=1 Tax=Streptomyces prasinosporus TaxID=68256 RepID=A0ABP6UC28_9ACTN